MSAAKLHLALYQPEIPQNTGTLIRLAACLGIQLDIIHPCGFIMNDKNLRRSCMDYRDLALLKEHDSWESFLQAYPTHRFLLLTPEAPKDYLDFQYQPNDILVLGQESTGFPLTLKQEIQDQVAISMQPSRRSLNVAICAAMVVGEALRQLR